MRASFDPLLVLGVAACAAGWLATSPIETAVVVAWVAWRWRGSRGLRALALCVFALGGVRAHARLAAVESRYAVRTAAIPWPARCDLEGVVAERPRVRRVGSREGARGDAQLVVRTNEARCGDTSFTAPWRVRLSGAPEHWRRGDRVSVFASVAPVRLFHNPGLADPRVRLALDDVVLSGTVVDGRRAVAARGLEAAIDAARARVRARIEATYAADTAPLARALVLGELDLEAERAQAFRLSGLSHLLAVSGTHLILVVLFAVGALQRVLARVPRLARRHDPRRLAAVGGVGLACLYADFAGGGGSAWRAAAMMSVALGATALGGRTTAARAVGLSMVVAAALEPLVVHDLSFALSLGATAGILLWGRGRASGPLRAVWGALRVTGAAMAGCAPALVAIGAPLSPVALAANVLAAPFGELFALPLCLLHSVLSGWPAAERGAAVVAGGALRVVAALAHESASIDALAWRLPPPTAWQLAWLALVAAHAGGVAALPRGGVRRSVRQRSRVWSAVAAIVGVLALEVAVRHARQPHGELVVTVLDVGQGDAIAVDLPDGRFMLVDGGGLVGSPTDVGQRVLLPWLRARRRRRIDVVALSHPHPDHYGGLGAVLADVEVGEIWDGRHRDLARPPGPSVADRLAATAAAPVLGPARLCGASRRFGDARVEVLAPCPGPVEGASANDNSLVLRIRHGRHAALLTGDAERDEEARLLGRAGASLRADFLKVGHHGSRTSTSSAFLGAVAPRVAAISCGVRNRFGHPHAITLRTLAAGGVAVGRTDRGGAVVWRTDGRRSRFLQLRGGQAPLYSP